MNSTVVYAPSTLTPISASLPQMVRVTLMPALIPALLVTLALVVHPAHGATTPDPASRHSYVVRLTDKPVAAYAGGISGLSASRALPGLRLAPASPSARAYADYLGQKHAAVHALVPTAPLHYTYKTVFNGFSVRLTDAEVRLLKASPAVAAIVPDDMRHTVTNYTPTFLGLDGAGGLWQQLGGVGHAGDEVIVGLLDTGIWPENPAFADRVDNTGAPSFAASATLAYGPAPAGWNGVCQAGEGFRVTDCNNKLIGARYFIDGLLADGQSPHWTEFVSPRDSLGGESGAGGHGTHTSSTAAGNHGVPAIIGGAGLGNVSGMAPRARVAMYKVCWSFVNEFSPSGVGNGCKMSDVVAAIEQATADGVQVLNYSINGGEDLNDPVELAFLQASNAGISVVTAAGNQGPGNTVGHISPWLTTVAASTHNRAFDATLTLANGAVYRGASLNQSPLPKLPLIRAVDAGMPGADPFQLTLCYSAASNGGRPVLDPARVHGKIVVCARGTSYRVDKSAAVKEAGGAGMVLVDDGNGRVAETHAVPTIHVSMADGGAITAYAATSGAAAALSAFTVRSSDTPAPAIAAFSSRGPNGFDPNVLKPDLASPGVDILAGVTPELTQDQRNAIVDDTLRPPSAWAHIRALRWLPHMWPAWPRCCARPTPAGARPPSNQR